MLLDLPIKSKMITVRYRNNQLTSKRCHLFVITIFFGLTLFFTFLLLRLAFRRTATPLSNIPPEGNQYFRLPTTLQPFRYKLQIKAYLPYRQIYDFGTKNFTIEGAVRIDFTCLKNDNKIILNAKELQLRLADVRVSNHRNEEIRVLSGKQYIQERDDIHIIEFILDETFESGYNYSIDITYTGIIGDSWAGGLYKTNYETDSETR